MLTCAWYPTVETVFSAQSDIVSSWLWILEMGRVRPSQVRIDLDKGPPQSFCAWLISPLQISCEFHTPSSRTLGRKRKPRSDCWTLASILAPKGGISSRPSAAHPSFTVPLCLFVTHNSEIPLFSLHWLFPRTFSHCSAACFEHSLNVFSASCTTQKNSCASP